MTHTVQLQQAWRVQCPIIAKIMAADGRSDSRILLQL